jgi:hypothetical protein
MCTVTMQNKNHFMTNNFRNKINIKPTICYQSITFSVIKLRILTYSTYSRILGGGPFLAGFYTYVRTLQLKKKFDVNTEQLKNYTMKTLFPYSSFLTTSIFDNDKYICNVRRYLFILCYILQKCTKMQDCQF